MELASSAWLLEDKALTTSRDISSLVKRYLGGHKLQRMPKRNLLSLYPRDSNELGRVNKANVIPGLFSEAGQKTDVFATTVPISLEVEFEVIVDREIECQFYCDFYRHGISLGGVRTESRSVVGAGAYRAYVEIPGHSLFKGRIQANVGVNLIANRSKCDQ